MTKNWIRALGWASPWLGSPGGPVNVESFKSKYSEVEQLDRKWNSWTITMFKILIESLRQVREV